MEYTPKMVEEYYGRKRNKRYSRVDKVYAQLFEIFETPKHSEKNFYFSVKLRRTETMPTKAVWNQLTPWKNSEVLSIYEDTYT